MSEKYNGYNNYETWLVALWIDNDQCYAENVEEMAARTLDDANTLSGLIKDYVEEMPDVSNAIENGGMVSDLVNSTLSDVDWYELAEMYIQNYKENNPEETESILDGGEVREVSVMARITLSIVKHPKGGYALEYPGGRYESCNVDMTDINKATQFKDYIAISAYIERSYPAYSTWAGQWVDNTHYSIEVE